MGLGRAAGRDEHFIGEIANPLISKPSEPVTRFYQTLFSNHGDVLGAGSRIGLEAGFARRQVDMSGSVLVDTGGERNDQYGVCAFVAIACVQRHDDDRPATFLRRIRRHLCKPDLPAKGRSLGRRHLGFAQKFAQGELAPFGLLSGLLGGQ